MKGQIIKSGAIDSVFDAVKIWLPSGGAIGVITLGDLQSITAITVGVVGVVCSVLLTVKKINLINRQIDKIDKEANIPQAGEQAELDK